MKSNGDVIHAFVRPGNETGFVAECDEICVVTQGATMEETLANLTDAVTLFFLGENPAEFGFGDNPTLVVTAGV
jgi:predicted RNase H-like HicB family nuclease